MHRIYEARLGASLVIPEANHESDLDAVCPEVLFEHSGIWALCAYEEP